MLCCYGLVLSGFFVLHWQRPLALVSVDELAAALDSQPNSVRGALSELRRLACLESIPMEVGTCWRLRERGLRLVAAANHLHIRNLTVTSDGEKGSETSRLVQRGETWLLQYMQHTAGIYGFFAALAQASR